MEEKKPFSEIVAHISLLRGFCLSVKLCYSSLLYDFIGAIKRSVWNLRRFQIRNHQKFHSIFQKQAL